MPRRDVTCSNCNGVGRWDVPVYGDSLRCEECGGKGSLREWRIGGLLVVLFALVSIAMFILGVWLGMDVMAFNREMVAVEGEPLPPPPCKDTWLVQSGDTVNDIIARCYDNPHYGRVKDELRPLNLHIADLGRIRPQQTIYLPERGRR